MVAKKTTLGLTEETLYNFNCAKLENRFNTADDFIMFLLSLLVEVEEREERNTLKPKGNHIEKETFKKDKFL